jgi:ELWxxDGT repeat protein
VGSDNAHGDELWITDGSTAGTHVVKDIRPGSLGSAPLDLIAANGNLFFIADQGDGPALWRSDGTTKGTIQVTHLNEASVVPTTPAQVANTVPPQPITWPFPLRFGARHGHRRAHAHHGAHFMLRLFA